jgi:hypothetical protein
VRAHPRRITPPDPFNAPNRRRHPLDSRSPQSSPEDVARDPDDVTVLSLPAYSYCGGMNRPRLCPSSYRRFASKSSVKR